MQADERQVRMAAQLYEMRDTAQRLLGGKYTAKMAELGAALRQAADRTGRQPLQIAIEVARDASPVDVCCLLAAAVELAEPSPAAVVVIPADDSKTVMDALLGSVDAPPGVPLLRGEIGRIDSGIKIVDNL